LFEVLAVAAGERREQQRRAEAWRKKGTYKNLM
jgi:hypothetical protein